MTPRYIDSNLAKAQFTGNFQDSYSPSEARVLIDEVPTADVAPIVHAHWMPKEHWVPLARDASPWSYDEDRYDYETHSQKELYWHCSHCDCIKSRIAKPVVPFCEQCGAQMDEEVEFIEDV